MNKQTENDTSCQRIKELKDSLIKKVEENSGEIYDKLESREYLSSLCWGDHLESIGIAEVSKARVTFRPDVPKQLDAPLHNKAILKVSSGRIIPLSQSLESFAVSNDKFWYFEIVC